MELRNKHCWIVAAAMCFLVAAAGQIVLDKKELTVRSGSSVYLRRHDLTFSDMSTTEECRVEVVNNDPISQRVGRVEPQFFDCDLVPHSVKYTHNGSPLLSSDSVKLKAHRFRHNETTTETFYLYIRIVNSSNRIIQTRGLRPVVVPEFNAISNAIDSSVVRFYESGNNNATCTVSFSKYNSIWPLAGEMVVRSRQETIDTFRGSCREFYFMRLHYKHHGTNNPDVDYLPLTVELEDPSFDNEPVIENFYLPIHIKGALPNSAPRSSYLSMYMMDVDLFVLTPLMPGVISAEDYETSNDQLVFNISRAPAADEGYFVNLDDHTTPINSFIQEDLENSRIAFQPPSRSPLNRRVVEAEFTVYDSQFQASRPLVLHIAIRNSVTNAPRVSYNKGLVLLEGQSRPITSENLQIVDRDNLDRVELHVIDGLNNGRLEINGRRASEIRVHDIQRGSVIYYHDDSDTTEDHISFRISDGINTVLVNFPITVIPKDDTPPSIVTNLGMQIGEGTTKAITKDMLLASDFDSVDDTIFYILLHPPQAGEIIRKSRNEDAGTRINRFHQRDIIRSQIYYRHYGGNHLQDSFQFKLRDHANPSNKSPPDTFFITINPANENPPELTAGATRMVRVLETDIIHITRQELEYTNSVTTPEQMIFSIVTPPYFVYNNGNEYAGKLISTHNTSVTTKRGSANMPSIDTFTQADINGLKIAYVPPEGDIGPEARLVRFVYNIEDERGNIILNQQFDVDIQPVNNQPPAFVTSKLLVEEGGIIGFTLSQLSATDVDTDTDEIEFQLEEGPNNGVIQKSGLPLQRLGTFNLEHIKNKQIRYIHDGGEAIEDRFTLSITDGANRESQVFPVEIVPIDDQAPKLRENLSPRLIVSEGSQADILPSVLSATDDDTDDHNLMFLITKQPKHGIIRLNQQPAQKFTQQDVAEKKVKYIHIGGEIGTQPIRDSVTFIVSDTNYMSSTHLPTYELNITIMPVDNAKPTIVIGSQIVVAEGGKFPMIPSVLTAKDPDTPPENIAFFIVQQPENGYIENVKPNPGSEMLNTGRRVTSFKLQDVIEESVSYVQAVHKGVEPTYDEFIIYATDGTQRSEERSLIIRIQPANDEAPEVILQNIEVVEGSRATINQTVLDVLDMDVPRDSIMLSISQPPDHGDIKMFIQTRGGEVERDLQDFSLDELHNGLQLRYTHDGSENFKDKFAVTVSDGRYTVKKICNVTVTRVNDQMPELTKNSGLQIEYGDYGLISSVVLQATDADNSVNEIFYVLVSVPSKGSLQFCLDPFTPTRASDCTDMTQGMNFTQHDVDMNRVRYIHTRRMGNTETDSFVFRLTDGKNNRFPESFEIRIRNSRKANLALLNRGFTVREGERTPISTYNLSASDESTRSEEIVFAIIRPPRLGNIELLSDPFTSISSFSQMDLASGRVVYNHLTKSDITQDSFTFTVTNGLSQAKDGEFLIHIRPLDQRLPSLRRNSLIEVMQGGDVAISSADLFTFDPDTAEANITYQIVKPPTYGHLYNKGLPVKLSFTQQDINLGNIRYESMETYTGLDNFLFRLSDGKHNQFHVNDSLQLKPVICSIFIKPVANDAPKMLVSAHPDGLEHFENNKYGFSLDSNNLRAVDSDTESHNLFYIITKRPMHGQIENIATKRYVRRKFSQKDLDDGNLRFVIKPDARSNNDSFMYRVMDARNNVLDNQWFLLHWATISFVRSRLVICENAGTVNVQLQRTGSLEQSSFVTIKINEMEARQSLDFTSTIIQVQFNPGQAEAEWPVAITADDIEEPNEKFRITLQDPENAILGKVTKATVNIINAENGRCSPFLGMISGSTHLTEDGIDGLLPVSTDFTDAMLTGYDDFRNIERGSPLDNTYNTDPNNGPSGASTSQNVPDSGNTRRRRRRKNNKRRRNGRNSRRTKKNRKSRRGKRKKNKATPGPSKPPQECTTNTRNLLHFDEFNQQLFKCDGQAWLPWAPESSQDQPEGNNRCGEGWKEYQGGCYKYFTSKQTWQEAESICQSSAASHLTSVKDRNHFNWLVSMTKRKQFWIGLNNLRDPNLWQYTNKEDVTFTHWGGQGSPQTGRSRKNCVLVTKRKRWKNRPCSSTKKRFVCEKLMNSKPKRRVSRRNKSRSFLRGYFS